MINWSDNARVFAMGGVVILHLAAEIIHGTDKSSWWTANIYDVLARWCVPMFVMISGNFLLNPNKAESIKSFYVNRASKILIPFIFWSLIYYLYHYFKEGWDISSIISNFIMGPAHWHLWYIYMLLGLYLVTPFLQVFICSVRQKTLILLCGSLFVAAWASEMYGPHLSYHFLWILWFIPYLSYYIAGYLMRSWSVDYRISLSVFLIACTMIIFRHFLVSERYEYFLFHYFSLTGILLTLSVYFIFKKINNRTWITNLAPLTFGIYLIHPIIIMGLKKLGFTVQSFAPVFSIPVLSIVVFAVSAAVVKGISKIPVLNKLV